ncbi:MAG TPA: glycosyltransferase family 2 protein [Myxococcaceae bacterium]|nr:glycosyltransferase family 2 protein [Myxococcaceae bacterium]
MAELLFWCAALLLLHTYFFYPLILMLMDAVAQAVGNLRYIRSGDERRKPRAADVAPPVSLVVAAYNEEPCIAEKLHNSLALDYPKDRFEVVIGSDGSTDRTDEIVEGCQDSRVRLSAAERAGKTSVLNRCVPNVKGDIVILSDANTMIDAGAVKKLVRHFRDPEVGAVCGKLKLYNPHRRDYEESAYWTYESLIKFYEGKRGAVMGANGGLYAIRRNLFLALPPGTIVDDFVIPLRILEQGYKVLYDPEAIAYEETTEDYGREFGRRARIAAGNFQSLRLLPGLLSPFGGFRAFAFWSHKLLRWCAPALMVLALAANAALISRPLYSVTLGAQLVFYLLAWAGSRSANAPGAFRRASSVAHYFVAMNLAIAVGFWRFLRGTQRVAWERTARA